MDSCCFWAQNNDKDVWNTGCNRSVPYMEPWRENIIECVFTFCPFCGKKIGILSAEEFLSKQRRNKL